MYLNDLASALPSNLPIRISPNFSHGGHGPFAGLKGIVMHHTGGAKVGESPSLGTVTNGREDLAGPLCNLFVSRSGVWWAISNGFAYHAGVVLDPATQANDVTIGIECEGTGVDPWPLLQYNSIVTGVASLIKHYALPVSSVHGHKEVCKPVGRKIDPNWDMGKFRADVAAIGQDDMSAQAEKQIQEIHDALFGAYTPANHHMNIPDNAIGLIIRIAHRLDIDVPADVAALAADIKGPKTT